MDPQASGVADPDASLVDPAACQWTCPPQYAKPLIDENVAAGRVNQAFYTLKNGDDNFLKYLVK